MPALLAIAFAFAFAFAPALARATTVDPPDFATLTKNADLIFRGEVSAVNSEWVGEGAQRNIVTRVTFNVLKALKGNPGSPYVLTMLGGTVGDVTMEVDGAPKFQVGQRSLLFVEGNGFQFVPLVGIMHGHYPVAKDASTGEDVVLKHDGSALTGTAEIDQIHRDWSAGAKAPAPKTGAKPMKRADFEDAIARQLATGKP